MRLVVMLFLCVMLLAVSVFAQDSSSDQNAEDQNVTLTQAVLQVKGSLKEAEATIARMRTAKLPLQRVSDLLLIAKELYKVQLEVIGQGKVPDFSGVYLKLNEIARVSKLAFSAHDELVALKERINQTAAEVGDVSAAKEVYAQAEQELRDERFERVFDLVEKTDEILIDLSSFNTRAAAMYDATTANITSFVSMHRVELGLGIGIPLFLFLLFRYEIKKYRLRAKIASLELEQNILKKEIQKCQEEYFVKGAMSESTYQTRLQAFGEMIRDLTREIALLREAQQKISTISLLRPAKKKAENQKSR